MKRKNGMKMKRASNIILVNKISDTPQNGPKVHLMDTNNDLTKYVDNIHGKTIKLNKIK